MYIMNPYVVHETNQIKGCSKWKHWSTTALDSNLNLANLCLLKETTPKEFVTCEGREGDTREINDNWREDS